MAHCVLVVEDEEPIVESLCFLMGQAGLAVKVARDGPTALEMIDSVSPDLMLLDVMIPGCDGFEVARAVRDNPRCRHMRILMLTARGREIDRRKGLELGIDGYMTKPFSTRDVVRRARALLGLDGDAPPEGGP
ncbi:response regulator transcription factor [Roseospirillum parvum]|uniref:Two-component system, OmpR family, alkaline phosphatase synthesis response regulator PhoP n=1 Tax=Roseospirillum parvum TaxID=83401 RepID=A0A1G7WSU1_9PROT|nr:response regulator [Roseospirillum parvum]SDG75013.1 two-component system, OmpR family, alkaline phosphatase synthesis response regulator PhoP [Roseospirillum parvum]